LAVFKTANEDDGGKTPETARNLIHLCLIDRPLYWKLKMYSVCGLSLN